MPHNAATKEESDMAKAQHTQSAIVAVLASGPGALSGFESRCTCGLVLRSSLPVAAQNDVHAHAAWHARTKR